MLIFLFLAFVAAFAAFHFGKYRLETPFLMNVLGAFFLWGAVFSIGGALAPSSGPWAGDDLAQSAYLDSLKSLGYAILAYGLGHILTLFKRFLDKPAHSQNHD